MIKQSNHLEKSAESLGAMQLDQAAFDRILDGWNRNRQTVETALANPDLSGDPTLQTHYRAAYNAALRTLLTRMVTVLGRSAMQLFIENLHRLPGWIEFSFQNVPLTTEAQRRTAVQGLIDAMNNAAVFAGFAQIDRSTLENILGRLKTLGEEARELIRNQLGNDLVFANQLKTAYRTAVSNLLARAATTIGSSVFDLYWQYRHSPPNLISEWADQQIAGISTPMPQGVAADPLSGNVEFRVGNVLIRILPDGARAQNGAETSINLRGITHNFHATGGVVDSVTPPNPVAEIQTLYGPNVTAASASGYGRGTTAEDTGESDTSLGFHEGRHALVFLTYFRNNAFPDFGGQVGQTQADYQAAWNTYANDAQTYAQTMNRNSEIEVDCVGVTIEQYYQTLGQVSPVQCP